MCSYTHTGLHQLNRRVLDGDIHPNFSNDEIIEVLNASNMLLLLMAYFFSIEMGFETEAEEIAKMILFLFEKQSNGRHRQK